MQHRLYWLIGILLILVVGLIVRLIDLTVLSRIFLRHQGDARTIRTVIVPAYRGMILDRNRLPLAVSAPVHSLWINPCDFNPSKRELNQLSSLLHLSENFLNKKIKIAREQNKEFLYLARRVNPSIANEIKRLKIFNVYFQPEYRRYYPEGEVIAHVLGFTNVDDQGQEGLELSYNQWLQGTSGIKRVVKDRLGHIVADAGIIRLPRPGKNLILSIDQGIQYTAFRELKAGVEKFKASSGSAVIVKVATGEILGMVNYPSYNPNNRLIKRDDRYRNRTVTDLFEPGSTIKSFGIATALISGKFTPNSYINTSPGWMIVGGKKIKDEHNNGVIDLTTILKISSNVGMSKIILSLPGQDLWKMLRNVGFGQITNSGFPGERSGILENFKEGDPFKLATLSFGYGLSVTALQLAQAYLVLASGGIKRPLSLLKLDSVPSGQRIMSKSVANEVLKMLESVLTQGGTAPLARVARYRVTGKTGTVRIVSKHGYEKHRYNSIFVGIAPSSNPYLLLVVVLHDPKGKQYYGGYTAGLIFSHIMEDALRLLNVPPDEFNLVVHR